MFAAGLARGLVGGDVFGLSGPLGAGKTTLVQAVAAALGIAGRVTSPTFVLVKTYPVSGKKFAELCHADVYRAKEGEVPDALAELLGDPRAVCFVEWAEKIRGRLPPETNMLAIEALPNGWRRVSKSRPA